MYTDELKANLFVEWLITAGLENQTHKVIKM